MIWPCAQSTIDNAPVSLKWKLYPPTTTAFPLVVGIKQTSWPRNISSRDELLKRVAWIVWAQATADCCRETVSPVRSRWSHPHKSLYYSNLVKSLSFIHVLHSDNCPSLVMEPERGEKGGSYRHYHEKCRISPNYKKLAWSFKVSVVILTAEEYECPEDKIHDHQQDGCCWCKLIVVKKLKSPTILTFHT